MQINHSQLLTTPFFMPIDQALAECIHSRECGKLSDREWLAMGVTRVLGDYNSGRDFLQAWNLREANEIHPVHFFQTAASARRGKMVTEVNTLIS